jgi:iron complex transport system permease protein
MMNRQLNIKIIVLFVILLSVILLAIAKGSVSISLLELFDENNRAILYLRLARILMAIIIGSGLAVSGIVLQAILRNPLAEPYILGTSSGAGLAVVLAIIIGVYKIYLPLAAFLGAILTIILVYNLAKQGNKIPVQSLILSGVIVSIALSGIVVFLITTSGNEALHGVMWWLWGSMQVYDFKLLLMVSLIVIIGIFTIFIYSQDLNAISIGEEEAIHLGINTETTKKILFFVTSLITAGIVSISGIIGFVGLVIPHIIRFVVGPNHKILIPAACIAAATFMVICDILSRTLFPPIEVPIGVITAVVGAPIFIILLRKKQKVV